jgi:hypothetical protein
MGLAAGTVLRWHGLLGAAGKPEHCNSLLLFVLIVMLAW